MQHLYLSLILCTCSALAYAQAAPPGPALSERDFLGDVPVVLSVSRLSQPVDEAPGAVTVLDRQFIRMSGARDVADLLRLVPGFQTTTSFETDAPLASYHGRSDDFSNRIQVLVDGRSVYAGYLQGSTGLGLQTLAIDDIERIEVMRGSNSAAFGARAFLGVINIVSRDVHETQGSGVRVNGGDNGVADIWTSMGWGSPQSAYRLSVDSRGDMGLRGARGVNRVSRANFTGGWSGASGSELTLRAGALAIDAGRGSPDSPGNIARTRFMGSEFLQGDLRLPMGDNEDVLVSASYTVHDYRDSFAYLDPDPALVNYYGIPIDFGAKETNQALSIQHTYRWNERWRTVWGAELRREQVVSPASFDQRGSVTSNFSRIFGNAEWRVTPDVLLNLGAMAEESDIGGGSVSPRAMVNWHVVPGHTLRAGISTAFRPPSAYEKYAAVRYYDTTGANPVTTVLSTGNVGPEKIFVRELGYNFNVPSKQLSGDVRLFEERITDGIDAPLKAPQDPTPTDVRNLGNFTITGAEHQLQWKPTSASRIFFTQTWTDIAGGDRFRVSHAAARYAMSLTTMYTTAGGYNLSLMHQQSEDIALMSDSKRLYTVARTDVRLGRNFLMGRKKAEISFVIQNLDQPYRDGDWKYFFDRRAFLSLIVEQ